MAFNVKSKKKKEEKEIYSVLIHTAKTTVPIHVRTFFIKAGSEKEAEKIGKKYAQKENPDKAKNYYFATAVGSGNPYEYEKTRMELLNK